MAGVLHLTPLIDWSAHIELYKCEDRYLNPTTVGYEAAAFWRYRGSYGADTCSKIERYPSSQWEYYT